MLAALPERIPLAQQVITGLFSFLISFILLFIICNGMFFEPGIAP